MARSLTGPATTEKNRTVGASFVRILEVQFGGSTGTQFYSDRDLGTPVSAEGRILDWGEIAFTSNLGQADNVSEVSIQFEDSDLFLKAENESQPGIQGKLCFVYLWFEGTSWPGDRVALFGGIITAPMQWTEESAAWTLTMTGFEHHFDRQIGQLATNDVFPEIDCNECENRLVPIVYGNPCYRVPACVIDRPGRANLNTRLDVVPDTSLEINVPADQAGFTVGSSINVIVGYPGRWEKVTGSFASGDSSSEGATSVFDITSRGSILAEGTLPGFFASGGVQYIEIPDADLPNNGATSRAGYPLYLQTDGGSWIVTTITYWSASGANRIVAIKGDLSISQGNNYKVGSQPGWIPVWRAGTPVGEVGSWKYVVNHLPSKSVDHVEAKVSLNVPGGDRQQIWARVNPAHYSVTLNDQSFNSDLGRGGSEPGMTTVTLSFTPQQVGVDEETVYVTLKGITDDNTTTGNVLEDPADVVENLLTNKFLGNVPSARVNSSSFTTAASSITTKCSFALFDELKSLNDICSDIAQQAFALYFWDEGQAQMLALSNSLSAADSEITVTNDNRRKGTLKIRDVDVKELVTEMTGRFRPAVTAPELVIVRASNESASSAGGNSAIQDLGLKRDALSLWAFQFPTSAATSVENWLQYWLNRNREVEFETFLNGLHLQVGDTITLDIDDGKGNVIFDSVLARVTGLQHMAANARDGRMESIRVTCELKLYDYGIALETPSDDGCVGNRASPPVSPTGKLYLQASGGSRSMWVDASGVRDQSGGGNVTDPVGHPDYDPNDDFQLVTEVHMNFNERPNPNPGDNGPDFVIGTLDADLTEGGSANITTDGGITVQVLERLGTGGETISSGKKVAAMYADDHNGRVVIATEC